LAAQAVAGKVEKDQARLLFDEGNIYRPEWRETALLLAGVLGVKQGKAKVDGLVTAILDRCGSALAQQARAAGLLGAIVNGARKRISASHTVGTKTGRPCADFEPCRHLERVFDDGSYPG
jgi:hypothetical protein